MIKKRKVFWILLLVIILSAIVLSSGMVLAQVVPPQPAQPVKSDLTLNLQPWNYSSGLIRGQVNKLYLEVRNNGNSNITNIRFISSNIPQGWTVNFTPASLDTLNAGSTNLVDVDITPPSDSSGRGNYTITLLAEANETRAVTTAFLTVQGGSSFWIWIGIGIGVVAAAVFVFIYLRFGRN